MTGYDPKLEEKKILDFWKKEKIYQFKPDKKNYSIDTPPPTVSGNMHAGHSYSYSQQDFIVRFRRMLNAGKGVFYPFGTDDNGLPTERLVEKINNVKSKEMSRSEFIKLCLKTLEKITPDFIDQWRRLGISADYNICYSTIDKNSQKISQKSFLELFKKGRIYTKDFPTMWCPECQTAIAQAELEDKEIPSNFITIKFKAEGKDLLIATTRPELIPACVAIFVNPKDSRYKSLKGKKARIPLFEYEVPIIFDDSASMDKGTGAMMVCSYGDKYDVDAIARHKLNPRIIFDKQGRIKEGNYQGLRIKQARKAILEDLEKAGLVREKKPITHVVNVHDKCGTEIEFIPTEQWFIKILDKKKELLQCGKKIKWYPEHMEKRYENWINGLEWDWIISRDRHFGIPFPVWKCQKCGEIIVADEKELPVDPLDKKKQCKKCKIDAVPEQKVFDTWATSSLTPQIASSLVGNKIKVPFSLRPQAHDIIRTWAFYTIARSLFHENELPWKDIMISGFVTLGGEKLSKSKGIIVDPKEIIEKYSADILRYWAAGASLGQDLEYQEKEFITGKKFINKLLNASNFVFMNLGSYVPKKPKKLEKIDELFLNVLNNTIATSTFYFGGYNNFGVKVENQGYNYSGAKLKTEQFFWNDFCDNYLEIVKWRVYNGTKEQKESAFYTLYTSLLTILKLISPITPFITEHIYQQHFRKTEKEKSIHLSSWPSYSSKKDKEEVEWLTFVQMLSQTRSAKTEKNKSMNAPIILTLPEQMYKGLRNFLEDLQHVTNAKEIKTGKEFKVEFVD